MNERRLDPYTGRWVIVAPLRKGIGGSKPGGMPTPSGPCPFCPGREADTEITVDRHPTSGPWDIRVVRNKYPVVSFDSQPSEEGEATEGVHEVVVESSDHDGDLPDFSPPHLRALLEVYRRRVHALEARPDIRAVCLFRNRGRRAGSSQPHPHAQLVGLSWIPSDLRARAQRAEAFRLDRGATLSRVEVDRERAGGRMLIEDEHFATYCPRAPSRPFEVRLTPVGPHADRRFARICDEQLDALTLDLGQVLGWMRERAQVTEYNMIVRQLPAPEHEWHLEILPRFGGDAGYELATGEMIVVVSPEEAARVLRQAPPT